MTSLDELRDRLLAENPYRAPWQPTRSMPWPPLAACAAVNWGLLVALSVAVA